MFCDSEEHLLTSAIRGEEGAIMDTGRDGALLSLLRAEGGTDMFLNLMQSRRVRWARV